MRIQVTFSSREEIIQASGTHFPLFLAWAVTIHKLQGMTIDEIVVDMSPHKVRYMNRQTSVALSLSQDV